MQIVGRILLIIGVFLFVIGGTGILFGFILKSSSLVAPMVALALIFVGAGTGIMKKSRIE
jgi:hypothetical protein